MHDDSMMQVAMGLVPVLLLFLFMGLFSRKSRLRNLIFAAVFFTVACVTSVPRIFEWFSAPAVHGYGSPGSFSDPTEWEANVRQKLLVGDYGDIAAGLGAEPDIRELMIVSELYLSGLIDPSHFSDEYSADNFRKYEAVADKLSEILTDSLRFDTIEERNEAVARLTELRAYVQQPTPGRIREELYMYMTNGNTAPVPLVLLQLGRMNRALGSGFRGPTWGGSNLDHSMQLMEYTERVFLEVMPIDNSQTGSVAGAGGAGESIIRFLPLVLSFIASIAVLIIVLAVSRSYGKSDEKRLYTLAAARTGAIILGTSMLFCIVFSSWHYAQIRGFAEGAAFFQIVMESSERAYAALNEAELFSMLPILFAVAFGVFVVASLVLNIVISAIKRKNEKPSRLTAATERPSFMSTSSITFSIPPELALHQNADGNPEAETPEQ